MFTYLHIVVRRASPIRYSFRTAVVLM